MTIARIFSRGIWKIPHLSNFLPEYHLTSKGTADVVLGWGLRPSTQKARAYAQAQGLPFIALEDGFLRSLGLGVHGWAPLSMVVDDVGIYYDTTRPSALEQRLLAKPSLTTEQVADTARAIKTITTVGLSKYNQAVDFPDSDFAKIPHGAAGWIS